MEPTTLYHELAEIYENYKPDDNSLLAEYPDLVAEMDKLDALNPQNTEETYEAIELLHNFIAEWFPDSIDGTEEERILNLFQEAEGLIQAFKMTKAVFGL